MSNNLSLYKNTLVNTSEPVLLALNIAMSHSLNLETIAEGVESAEQEAFLLQYTCDDMQGFLYSKPINAEAMHELLLRLRS